MSSAASSITLTGANQVARGAQSVYRGFAVRETAGAGAGATIRIWDNAAEAGGRLLDVIRLAANESAREQYPDGIWASDGIFVEVVAGAVEGVVRIG